MTEPFRAAVLAGLAQRPKIIPARFFYDARGGALFEAITRLPEYYPTRTEAALIAAHAADIARLVGPGRVIVEFGSGSSEKTPALLRALAAAAYVPVDISADALEGATAMLTRALPGLAVTPVVADFMGAVVLPAGLPTAPRLGFFPGSTIGNLGPAAAADLLRRFAATLGPDAWLAIGIDRKKTPALLEAAYDDAGGVTARFNLNLLDRMRHELGARLDRDGFVHRARWRDPPGRIEMHLEATRATTITIGQARFELAAGETIHTENSYKYTTDEARLLARAGGWEPVVMWTDDRQLFALHLWRVADHLLQP